MEQQKKPPTKEQIQEAQKQAIRLHGGRWIAVTTYCLLTGRNPDDYVTATDELAKAAGLLDRGALFNEALEELIRDGEIIPPPHVGAPFKVRE